MVVTKVLLCVQFTCARPGTLHLTVNFWINYTCSGQVRGIMYCTCRERVEIVSLWNSTSFNPYHATAIMHRRKCNFSTLTLSNISQLGSKLLKTKHTYHASQLINIKTSFLKSSTYKLNHHEAVSKISKF